MANAADEAMDRAICVLGLRLTLELLPTSKLNVDMVRQLTLRINRILAKYDNPDNYRESST